MTLAIGSIHFDNFRNYKSLDLSDLGSLTIFIGKNGVGKTNILEGIQLLTAGVSFRHAQIQEMVGPFGPEAYLCAQIGDSSRALEVELFLEPGKKSYNINGKKKKTADIQGLLPAVIFCPDDLDLAKRSSSVRRDALDTLGSQVSSGYSTIARDYEKVVRYKNRLLKEEADKALIESIGETLVTCGTQLFAYRYALMQRLLPLISRFYKELSAGGEDLQASYTPSWDHEAGLSATPGVFYQLEKTEIKQRLEQGLVNIEEQEISRKRSLIGPHNDKIEFFLGGRNVTDYASQGQQRSIVLAWKLAEVELIQQIVGQKPVLLLDDVMSELDTARRDALITCIKDDIQTFVSATDLSYFNEGLLEKARVVEIPGDVK